MYSHIYLLLTYVVISFITYFCFHVVVINIKSFFFLFVDSYIHIHIKLYKFFLLYKNNYQLGKKSEKNIKFIFKNNVFCIRASVCI